MSQTMELSGSISQISHSEPTVLAAFNRCSLVLLMPGFKRVSSTQFIDEHLDRRVTHIHLRRALEIECRVFDLRERWCVSLALDVHEAH